jgi:hypothetical protein
MSALLEPVANLQQEFRWNLRQICDETRFEDRILLCGRQLRELFSGPDPLPHETTVPQVVISGASTCLLLPGYGIAHLRTRWPRWWRSLMRLGIGGGVSSCGLHLLRPPFLTLLQPPVHT